MDGKEKTIIKAHLSQEYSSGHPKLIVRVSRQEHDVVTVDTFEWEGPVSMSPRSMVLSSHHEIPASKLRHRLKIKKRHHHHRQQE